MNTTDINTSTAIDSARAALCSFLQSYGTSWTTRPEVIDLRESPVMTESLLIHFLFPIPEQYGPSLTERLAEHIHDTAGSVEPMVAPP